MGQLCSCTRAQRPYKGGGKSSSQGDLLTFGVRYSHCYGRPNLSAAPYPRPRRHSCHGSRPATSTSLDPLITASSTLTRDTPRPRHVSSSSSSSSSMIRQKPPPKPPRMRPSPAPSLQPPSSPAISSLKSSIVDVTSTLDASILCGSFDLTPASRLAPTVTREDKIHSILEQTKDYLATEVHLDPLLEGLLARGVITKLTHQDLTTCRTPESTWEQLIDVIILRGIEGFRALVQALEVHHEYLAHLLLVLDQLVDIAMVPEIDNNSNSVVGEEKTPLCPVCEYNTDEPLLIEELRDTSSKFDIEILYMDTDSGQTKGLKELLTLKKRKQKTTSVSSMEEKLLYRNESDRYVPVISLTLYQRCLCQNGLQKLVHLLEKYSCIRELSIAKNHLNVAAMEALGTALMKNSSLLKLDLRLNSISEQGADELFSRLKSNNTLKTINIASTELSPAGCRHLLQGIGSNPSLTDLDLGFNDLQDEGTVVLAEALSRNWALRKLRMRANYVTCDGARKLFRALKKNSRLCFLDLSENKLRDESMSPLSELLLCNRSLKEVSVEGCEVGPAGCVSLARALKTNSSLKRLDLSRNNLGDEGVEALAEGVKYNPVLETLCLNMCGVANSGFGRLMDSLQYNAAMTTLKLCYNNIGCPATDSNNGPVPSIRDIYEKVCQILQSNKDLKVLLWGNKLDYEEQSDVHSPPPPPQTPKVATPPRRVNTSLDSMGASSGHSNHAFVEEDSFNASFTSMSVDAMPHATSTPLGDKFATRNGGPSLLRDSNGSLHRKESAV